MIKRSIVLILILLLVVLTACTKEEIPTLPEDESLPLSIEQVVGLEDIQVIQNEYFDPLKGVEVINQNGENISYLFEVDGQIDYGVTGSYNLSYQMTYGEDSVDETRIVNVVAGTIVRPVRPRNTIPASTIVADEGSYRGGTASDLDHPVVPQNINSDLLTSAVPSNGWWTSLLAQNYGGSNGIYTNPFRSAFSNSGVEITNPGTGFVQYWNPDGYNTMANFSLALPDMFLKTSTLNLGYTTHVIDYSDTTVKVAMRNVGRAEDHMVVTYAQGSPYIFAEVMDSSSPYISFGTAGLDNYEYYTIDGTKINDGTYSGDGIVVKLVRKHVGYETYRPAQVGQPIYADRYFLISTPENSAFIISSDNHPFGLLNKLSMDLNQDNYLSVAMLQSLGEASFYHDHAYAKTLTGNVSYDVDHIDSTVETTYDIATQYLKESNSNLPVQFLMPHHYQNSEQELTEYSFGAVRGELKLMIGSSFSTSLSFNGVLPGMTLPTNSEFSETDMTTYLNDLGDRTEINDTENFLNDEGPYWNSKALYPLAQGIIIADQIGNDDLKQEFISKLRYVLEDWFTYSSTSDERYLYYNEAWGSVYYSNNDFNTASELSDHSFTHGYLTYASGVLAMYDESFVEDYGDMVSLLLSDYMYPEKGDYEFAYLRSFDPWAGHTWAHGFGTFAEGNNIESSSEALQSWLGGYLWALNNGDTKLRDAAIYGFVSELSSAKTYMFDYSEEIFPDKYSEYASVAGMLWGGKYDYATWFGANPTFIYGIQWLPNGEYLSNYAVNDVERERLSDIYANYLSAKNQTIDTWYANMWSIQALLDPAVAINQFSSSLILNDDYPSDLSQTYYLINGLKTYGQKTDSYHMVVHEHVTSSIYDLDGEINALIWNASSSVESIFFVDPNGEIISKSVPAKSFTVIQLS